MLFLKSPSSISLHALSQWAGDRCCVCDSDVDYDFDQLVSCDKCGLTMHQSCYGIGELPGVDDVWMCRACEVYEAGQRVPQCCLCPVAGGALKPTRLEGMWCHAACMQWIPDVSCARAGALNNRVLLLTVLCTSPTPLLPRPAHFPRFLVSFQPLF